MSCFICSVFIDGLDYDGQPIPYAHRSSLMFGAPPSSYVGFSFKDIKLNVRIGGIPPPCFMVQ
jgi:hypothetical protein